MAGAYRCAICGRDNTPLLEANVKGMGFALICPSCWSKLAAENRILVSSSGGGCSCG
ncbi:MAG: hypothetical protein LM577_05815 [Thermoproteaceae archaeon]|nr:hypothetical protein [Thermoproteaceae archaeon]